MNAIECKALNKSFGTKRILGSIDFSVGEGEFVGLVGINGCGKSTLIKSILDLISIDGGSIKLFDQSHRRVSARKNIAYMPDRFSPPAHLKSKDFIHYMLELHAHKHTQQDIDKCLDALELDRDSMEASVSKLSKGMTQKLGLASCLLSGKSLFILDEPMSGLDPKARVLFKRQLHELKKIGVSLFFSSHMLADVEELADKMIVLHDSQICFSGPSVDFKNTFGSTSLEEAYMNCIA